MFTNKGTDLTPCEIPELTQGKQGVNVLQDFDSSIDSTYQNTTKEVESKEPRTSRVLALLETSRSPPSPDYTIPGTIRRSKEKW